MPLTREFVSFEVYQTIGNGVRVTTVPPLRRAFIEVAGAHANIGRDALLRATALLWQAQDVYTDAMTAASRRQAMQLALEDEAGPSR